MSTPTHSDREVGERYGKSKEYAQRAAREGRWPHLRIGRSIRFTDAHVAQIDLMHEVKATASAAATSWGRRTKRAS